LFFTLRFLKPLYLAPCSWKALDEWMRNAIENTFWELDGNKGKKKNPPHPPPGLRWGPFEVQFFKYFDNELIWLANHSKKTLKMELLRWKPTFTLSTFSCLQMRPRGFIDWGNEKKAWNLGFSFLWYLLIFVNMNCCANKCPLYEKKIVVLHFYFF